LVCFTIFHLFSPWKLVIERRSASNSSNTGPSPDGREAVLIPAQDSNPVELDEQSRKKDYIESNFGDLENKFINSMGKPSVTPKRSRDDSIKLMYDTKSPGDWLDFIEGHDDHVCLLSLYLNFYFILIWLRQGLMALTKATQRYIYEKQNPVECRGQKFLVLNKFPGDDAYGLGAIVQHISDYLSVAIQTNSVLLYAEDSPPGQHFIQDPEDGGDSSCGRSFDCIFEKLSKCSTDAQKGIDSKVQSVFAHPIHENESDFDAEAYLAKYGSPIPPLFETALKSIQPDITGEMLKYWWRAQAAGYIMRLNNQATSRIKDLRLGNDSKQIGIQWDTNGQPQNVELPFPMPEGTISIHVRHGDKG
jgi:hypothetical protein